jgi:hypothetical protein
MFLRTCILKAGDPDVKMAVKTASMSFRNINPGNRMKCWPATMAQNHHNATSFTQTDLIRVREAEIDAGIDRLDTKE